MRKKTILLTNDDGINAAGIAALADYLKDYYNLVIVAPRDEQSGASSSITLTTPLFIKEVEWKDEEVKAYSINGRPTDCVKIAYSVILKYKPDLVISGINRGTNSGRNVLYSGTVGAIIEATHRSIPGIAISCADFFLKSYENAKSFLPGLVEFVLEHGLPEGTFLNVNYPSCAPEDFKGLKLASQGLGYWVENPAEGKTPMGETYYWLGGMPSLHETEPNTDNALIEENYGSAVPVHINDLTDYKYLEAHQEKFSQIFEHQELSKNT